MSMRAPEPVVPAVLLGRAFGPSALARVREVVSEAYGCSRAEIARRLCQRLSWGTRGGVPALMSARVALLRLHRAGLVELPPPRNGNANGRAWHPNRVPEAPDPQPLQCSLDQLPGLGLHPVGADSQSCVYNELVGRYHYLGFMPMAGAQMRYLARWEGGWLGALGFGAAAWQMRARDEFIGWDHAARQSHLHLVVNNSRFLILPWVHCANLASTLLAMSVRRLAADFHQRYGYAPVLVESCVEEGRFEGTSYRAANWQRVGWTQGRGKKGQWHQARLPRKAVWVYPLRWRFRQILCGRKSTTP